jgi:hypothetical protein
MFPEKSPEISIETLTECFADLPDPRIDRSNGISWLQTA